MTCAIAQYDFSGPNKKVRCVKSKLEPLLDATRHAARRCDSDAYPWPTLADGLGDSLHQKTPLDTLNNSGNDVINWKADDDSPGQ